MSFFKVLFSLCSGTGAFPRLTGLPVWRAFMHLFFLILLCCAVITAAFHFIHSSGIDAVTARFFAQTGPFVLTLTEIRPEKDPAVSRSYRLSRILRFDYFANAEDFKASKFPEGREQFGILCLPGGAAFWSADFQNPDAGRYRAVYAPASVVFGIFAGKDSSAADSLVRLSRGQNRVYTAAELKEAIEKNLVGGTENNVPGSASPEHAYVIREREAAMQANMLAAAFNLAFYLTEVLMLLVITVFFFSLAQFLRARIPPLQIPLKAIVTATVYASFPPLIAATFFRALELRFPSFQTVFFISFFAYQLFAFNAVFQHFNPRRSGPEDSDPNL